MSTYMTGLGNGRQSKVQVWGGRRSGGKDREDKCQKICLKKCRVAQLVERLNAMLRSIDCILSK